MSALGWISWKGKRKQGEMTTCRKLLAGWSRLTGGHGSVIGPVEFLWEGARTRDQIVVLSV